MPGRRQAKKLLKHCFGKMTSNGAERVKKYRRKRPDGCFLLVLSANNHPQSLPMHPSWADVGPASPYGGTQLLPCFAPYELTLVQRDPAHSLAHYTSLESWNESHEQLPFGQEYSSQLWLFSETSSALCLRAVPDL